MNWPMRKKAPCPGQIEGRHHVLANERVVAPQFGGILCTYYLESFKLFMCGPLFLSGTMEGLPDSPDALATHNMSI